MATYVQLASGVVVPEASFAEAKGAGAPFFGEIATTADGRDITRGFVEPLDLQENGDSVLASKGGDLKIYEELKRDEQVASTFQQRRLAVTSTETQVLPGDKSRKAKKAAEHLKEYLIDHLDWDAVCDKMLWGVFFGYSVGEVMWAPDGAAVAIDAIKVRKRQRFRYRNNGSLVMLTSQNPQGEALPDKKMWVFATGADNDDEPYGLGLAHFLYWPVFFKRGGMRLWMRFLDKFGAPTAKGTFPRNATPEQQAALLATLRAISTDSGVIIPEGMEIGLIEASRSGNIDYRTLQDYMNAAIAKINLSQTLTTENTGGQFKADIQMDVRNEVIKADADLLSGSLNRQVVRWWMEYNYPGVPLPRVWRVTEEGEDQNKLAERDSKIYSLGYDPTPEYIEGAYGPGWEKRAGTGAGDTPPPLAGPAFADPGTSTADETLTPGQQLLDQLIADLPPELLQGAAEALLKPAIRAAYAGAAAGEDPDQLHQRLVDAFPSMDADRLQELLARIFFVVEVVGRLEAQQEAAA